MMPGFAKDLIDELRGEATDKFLELLLAGMDLAFMFSGSYRRQIEDFEARYVFATDDGRVEATADFADGDMKVHDDAREPCTVRVNFTNAAALRDFLFSKDQDILQSILKNEVSVEGNLNYVHKFGFMARDLGHRLGVV